MSFAFDPSTNPKPQPRPSSVDGLKSSEPLIVVTGPIKAAGQTGQRRGGLVLGLALLGGLALWKLA